MKALNTEIIELKAQLALMSEELNKLKKPKIAPKKEESKTARRRGTVLGGKLDIDEN